MKASIDRIKVYKEIIQDTRSLISKGWCQDSFAKDAEGGLAYIFDTNAVSWCFSGALHRARFDKGRSDLYTAALREVILETINDEYDIATADKNPSTECSLSTWNDEEGRKQQDVLDVLDAVARKLDEIIEKETVND